MKFKSLFILTIGMFALGLTSVPNNTISIVRAQDTYTKAELQAKINEISDEKIASFILIPSVKTNLESLKAQALVSIPSYPSSGTREDFPDVFSFLDAWDARYDSYVYQASNPTVGQGLPFLNLGGSNNGVNKLNDGRLQFSFQNQFSKRIRTTELFDATNFDISFNVGKVPLGNVLFFNINPKDTPFKYPSEQGQYFHIEVNNPKATPNKKMIVVGDGNRNHNVSIDGYKSEATGAGFSGRFINNNESGDFIISLKTDYDTGSTTFDVNNGAIHYTFEDNSVLYGGKKQLEPLDCYICMGMMLGNGDYQEVMMYKMYSPKSFNKEFKNGSNDDILLPFDLSGASVNSFTLDDNPISNSSYKLYSDGIKLVNKYLNTLSIGKHTIKLVSSIQGGSEEVTTYHLNVIENDNPLPPDCSDPIKTISLDNINDLPFNFNIHGALPSDLVIKCGDDILENEKYEWSDFNQKFTLKSTYLSTLSPGIYYYSFNRSGVTGEQRLKLIVKSSSQSSSSSSSSTSSGGGSSTLGTGAIVGIVAGGVVVLAGVVILTILLSKKRRK